MLKKGTNMRQHPSFFPALAAVMAVAALAPPAQAQSARLQVVDGNGLDVFGGVFTIAPNRALAMEGPGRDIGRDIAAHWVTYRWADPARSAAMCEVNFDRTDHLGFYAANPDQATLDAETEARMKQLAATPQDPWVSSVLEKRRWGQLNLFELASTRKDGSQTFNLSALYAKGPYTYTMGFLCTNAPMAELRALAAAIAPRNLTQS
jgi:hypothetical protein